MLSSIKPRTEGVIKVIAWPFLKLDPNLITVMGIIPPILFFVFLVTGYKLWALISMLGIAFDFVDGYVARSTGKVTAFGGVLDSTLDRFSDALYISAFAFAGLVSWGLALSLIVLSYLISYIRSRAELAGKAEFKLDVGIMERGERLIAIVVATAVSGITGRQFLGSFTLVELVFAITIVLSFITVVQRLVLAHKKLSR
jgi:archaetidylinositol phosphate synthase